MYTWKWFFSFGGKKEKERKEKERKTKKTFVFSSYLETFAGKEGGVGKKGGVRSKGKSAAMFSKHFRVGGQGDTAIPFVFISAF